MATGKKICPTKTAIGQSNPAYTEEQRLLIVEEICERIGNGECVVEVFDNPGPTIPITLRTFYNWKRTNPAIEMMFVEAKEVEAERVAERLRGIAKDASNDLIMTDNGPMPNPSAVQRSRLQIDTEWKIIQRKSPRTWGDKLEVSANVTVQQITGMKISED